MIVGFKDCLKFIGIIIVSFCAVFVCTFFLNFYLDAKPIEKIIDDAETLIIYNAQMATAKLTCAISGGFLGLIAAVMLLFYIKLYVSANAKNIGICKAMGYSDARIAFSFCIFGLSVLIGALLGFGGGFIIMPTIYDSMTIGGLPEIEIGFHFGLMICLTIVPTVFFTLLSFLFAYFTLRKPVCELLRGKTEKIGKKIKHKGRDRSFLKEMCLKTLFGKKLLAFFVAFAGFCFSTMVQMSFSMLDLSSATMGAIILVIGVVLSVTSIFMALTSIVNGNIKNLAIMKTFGYSTKQCALTVLGGYHLFAIFGFAVGTVYQYGLLSVMVNFVYTNVGGMPDYGFNVAAFFLTLIIFVVLYEAVMAFYVFKISNISIKAITDEN